MNCYTNSASNSILYSSYVPFVVFVDFNGAEATADNKNRGFSVDYRQIKCWEVYKLVIHMHTRHRDIRREIIKKFIKNHFFSHSLAIIMDGVTCVTWFLQIFIISTYAVSNNLDSSALNRTSKIYNPIVQLVNFPNYPCTGSATRWFSTALFFDFYINF